MPKRRRRRTSLGSSPREHATQATQMLNELRRTLLDVELGRRMMGKEDCRLGVNQLHVLNHMQGQTMAHVHSMGGGPKEAYLRELDRCYNRIDKIEQNFVARCVRDT